MVKFIPGDIFCIAKEHCYGTTHWVSPQAVAKLGFRREGDGIQSTLIHI